jgi:hypothetical protein
MCTAAPSAASSSTTARLLTAPASRTVGRNRAELAVGVGLPDAACAAGDQGRLALQRPSPWRSRRGRGRRRRHFAGSRRCVRGVDLLLLVHEPIRAELFTCSRLELQTLV